MLEVVFVRPADMSKVQKWVFKIVLEMSDWLNNLVVDLDTNAIWDWIVYFDDRVIKRRVDRRQLLREFTFLELEADISRRGRPKSYVVGLICQN